MSLGHPTVQCLHILSYTDDTQHLNLKTALKPSLQHLCDAPPWQVGDAAWLGPPITQWGQLDSNGITCVIGAPYLQDVLFWGHIKIDLLRVKCYYYIP